MRVRRLKGVNQYTQMEICTCHFRENLEWLPADSVTVVHKEGGDPVPEKFTNVWTIPNVGTEGPAYLWYIIQRYDSLPDTVAFIHGHEESHHQQGDRPLLEMIRDANSRAYGYVPLGNAWNPMLRDGQLKPYVGFIEEVLELVLPEFFVTCSGAQFVVTRERIQRNSLEFYTKLYNRGLTFENCISLEFSWHVIFGEPWMLLPRRDYFSPPIQHVRYARTAEWTLRFEDLKIVHVKSGTTVDHYGGNLFYIFNTDTPPENFTSPLAVIRVREDLDKSLESISYWCAVVKFFADYMPNTVLA